MANRKSRLFLICLAVLIGLSVVAGSGAMAADKPPIKIGLLLPYTGTMPFQTKGVNDSVELYFGELGMKAGGRPIQIIKEDDENNPTTGLTKVRRLVEQQKVNFIVGPVNSAVGLAIQDYVRKQNVILLNPVANTRELTGPDKWAENVFRTVETSDQCNYPMGAWIIKNTPYRNMAITGSDFAGGHHNVEAFKAGFEAAGGKVVKEIFPKLGTMDFAPFLSGMEKGIDATYAMYVGTDAVRFVQQYEEFGIKKRIPLYGFVTIADDPYLPGVGDAAIGLITSSHYPVNLDTPKNKAFVKSYTSRYGHPPYRYSEYGYTAASMIGATIEALKGDVEDSARTAKEMKKTANTLEMPSGPLAFDQYNQRIVNMYVVKTEKRDGKLVNVVVDKLGRVAQTDVWKWWVK
ncbi:MAG TPA: ABC transporter substrate-binding protein [Syntrophorhabdales bacterium]|nr:ABC transporter substrate-binding protein [Syntrophorhabdales bacterium]